MSGNAARASITAWLERQIVVLLIQRLRERVERFWGFAAGFRGPLHSPRSHRSGSASGPQHDQLTRDDLGDVARLLVATERVATREPLFVLRTSGSAPKFPIIMTLLRLRLTTTSSDNAGVGPRVPNTI